jgi:hypothetical protein
MADKTTRFTNRIIKFLKSRTGLLLFFALQIFVVKARRSKPVFIGSATVVIAAHLIAMHIGMCPLKYVISYICKS